MFGPIDGIGMAVLIGIFLLILLARFTGWGTGIWPPRGGPF
jgi:hypothetical protein